MTSSSWKTESSSASESMALAVSRALRFTASQAIGGKLTLLLVKPDGIFSFKQRSEFVE